MLNNLNSTIITPLSPKNQKINEAKFIHNDFCNDISPEFLTTKNKSIKKYMNNSNVQQNNDTSNFLLFTPADIRQHNISVNSAFTENYKTVYETNTEVSNFTTTFNNTNQNSNIEKSYSADTSSSNDMTKNYNEYPVENNVYFKNYNSKVMNNTLLSNTTLNSQTNNLYKDLNSNGEISNTYLNYNLISNEYLYKNGNSNAIKNNKIFKNDNLMELEEKNLNNFNLNSNILNQNESNSLCSTLSSHFSNYQSSENLNMNPIPLSNITNTSSISITSTKGMESSLNLKRKLQNSDSDNNINDNYKNKKLRTTTESKVLVDKTFHLINKTNEPISIDNKYNTYATETKSISENVDISLKETKSSSHIYLKNVDKQSIFMQNDTHSTINLSLKLSNNNHNNIIKEKSNSAIPMSNILPNSYYNKNENNNTNNTNNNNGPLDITDGLNKMDIVDKKVEEKARNITINSENNKTEIKNEEKKTKLVIKISKKMLKQHDNLNNDRKSIVHTLTKFPAKLKSLIEMSRSQFSYICNSNTPVVPTPKEARQIRNIAEQIYGLNNMYRFTDETLYLSMNYVYRYTKSVCRIQSKMLELIILTAMYIAGKFNEELNEPTITDVISSSTAAIKMNDIKKMERKMLAKLNWNLYITSPQSILIEYMNYLKETTGLAKPVEKYVSSFRAFNYIVNNNFSEFLYPVYIIAFSEILLLPANFNINKNSVIQFLSLEEDEIKQLNECTHLLFERVKERRFKKISIRNNCVCDKCLKNNKK